jgi:hypothetical protein
MAAALAARVFEDYYNMRASERQIIIQPSGFER